MATFGRALMALNIDIICANSPQAKGRIEPAFGTLQDRMVKELRLAGVSSIAAANTWLPGFSTAYNTRFGRDPANTKDLHRPLAQADDLDEILAWREERTVTRPARSSTTSGCRPCWSKSRRSRPLIRRGSSVGTLRGSGRPTTSRRRVCRRRGGHHATVLPRPRPEAANRDGGLIAPQLPPLYSR